MADRVHPQQPAPSRATAEAQRARPADRSLINPTVRGYMEALNLERFYGGYVVTEIAPEVLNLGIGEVGGIPLDEEVWAIGRRYVAETDLAPHATRYRGTMGERETNRLMAARFNAWLATERFRDDLVVSLDGGQNGIDLAARVFTSPLGSVADAKQFVLMAVPAYPYLSSIVPSHAGVMAFPAYDGEAFARGVETYCNPAVGMILVNVPHNPMGYALTAQQAERISRVAAVYNCAIVVDAVYGDYAADPAVGHALARLDPERTVFIDSFSKKFGLPGLRLGFALSAAESLTYALRFVKMGESLSPSAVKLAFAGHLLARHGSYPARIAAEIRARHERFLERFGTGEAFGAQPFGEAANPFYRALDIRGLLAKTGLADTDVARYCLDAHRVRVIPGAFIYPSQALQTAHFSGQGRLSTHGDLPFLPPRFPAGAQFVYAPDFPAGAVPLLRLSFGVETRIDAAADGLRTAFERLWEK